MPKKFASENPKVTAARDRKATVKKEETEKKQKAAEDAYWADDDKLASRKLQRKEEDERKKELLQKRKEENRRLAEEEMSTLSKKAAGPVPVPTKVTRATIDKQRELELKLEAELEEKRKLDAQKIEVVPEDVHENINKLSIDGDSARNVDEALQVLGESFDDLDRHPEKRMKAAYLAFEEKRLPQLKVEHPTYRLSQLKQLLKKEWLKSPENPLNARILAISK